MSKQNKFVCFKVDTIPEKLLEGVIYYSPTYKLIVHKCACGCGMKVSIPLRLGWEIDVGERQPNPPYHPNPTVRPSIFNYQFPCRSNYNITNGEVQWLQNKESLK